MVDYAHKPAALAAVLDTLRAQVPGRLITVLGCGGDRDRGKRPLMGAAAAQRSDVLVVTDDNPRSERPADIRAAMLAGALDEPGHGELHEIGDRRAAIAGRRRAGPGDAVVVAGKGHETRAGGGGRAASFRRRGRARRCYQRGDQRRARGRPSMIDPRMIGCAP